MPERVDVVVVGAGPAGAACSVLLGRAGFDVLLVDKARFPRDKPCGEGIMPHGVAVLEELGLRERLLAAGARPFGGLRYVTRGGASAEGRFPEIAGTGLVLRRLELDRLMVEAARAEPRVCVVEEAPVTELLWGRVPGERGERGVTGVVAGGVPVQAALTIGADGLGSRVRGLLGRSRSFRGRQRYGLRAHVRGVRGLGPQVEVLLHEGGEVYMTQCGPEEALVALLLEREAVIRFRGLRPEAFLEHLRRCPPLKERVRDAEPPQDLMAAGPLGYAGPSPCGAGWLLAGDSAGALDPITAEGIALALQDARLAAEAGGAALRRGDLGSGALAEYGRRWRRQRRDAGRMTQLVLRICRHGRLAERAVRRLAECPELFTRLLGVSVGAYPYSSIGLGEKLRFVLGL